MVVFGAEHKLNQITVSSPIPFRSQVRLKGMGKGLILNNDIEQCHSSSLRDREVIIRCWTLCPAISQSVPSTTLSAYEKIQWYLTEEDEERCYASLWHDHTHSLKHRDNILKNYKGIHKYTCILAPALEDAI